MAAKPFVAVDFCKKIIGRCSKLAEKKAYLLINGQQCIPPSDKLLETNLDTSERVQHKLLDKPIHSPHVGPTSQELIHILVRAHEILSEIGLVVMNGWNWLSSKVEIQRKLLLKFCRTCNGASHSYGLSSSSEQAKTAKFLSQRIMTRS